MYKDSIYSRLTLAGLLIIVAFSVACGWGQDRGDRREGAQMHTLRVVTSPWDGGDFRLDPLPSNENSSTIQGDYRKSEPVTIRVLPAPGWEVTRVDQAQRVGDSNDFQVVMERDRTLAISFRELPGGNTRVDVTPQITSIVSTNATLPVKNSEKDGDIGTAKTGTEGNRANLGFIGWSEFRFSGEPWEEVAQSDECSKGGCLRARDLQFSGDSTLQLWLYHASDPRFGSYMNRKTISFDVKHTSQSPCCETFRFSIDSTELRQWSGTYDWRTVILPLPESRPLSLEWAYSNNGIMKRLDGTLVLKDQSGNGELWIRDVRLR